ncbi:carbohydrate ABC transporter permease [Maledivibacter halophilus]|uniref:Carbohydrate ABC transporter membrane protein 2, CUT1 family (TC 3.A.1.1.-) n=1 Tax=Maledivibacter halophilus TaxID=36842 RepID=A0A1T5ILU0_9FIRM|nr:carbohydrate ABC transporter permease [Maledivibacter halophilus]SKC40080.1 carbohydrate ABC transporter membrane protein 2, CUT1 family (TC 3.A.1.1.-) [Maledivibacter halophilus]
MILKPNKLTKKRITIYILLTLMSVFFIYPVIAIFANSFMGSEEISDSYSFVASLDNNENNKAYMNIKLIPDMFDLTQYINILFRQSFFLRMFWNSTGIVAAIIIGQLFVSSTAAYVFCKISFKGQNKLFFIYIITMMMPFQVTLVPNYLVVDRLGITNTYAALILPAIFAPFGVFLMKQFMNYIPKECIEAASVDGAGYFQIFIHIVLPMLKPAIASLIILLFIDYWNMVEQPLLFIDDAVKRPLSTYLSIIGKKDFHYAFAASTIYMLPPLLMFLYWESYLVEGIQLNSGMK